jgi:hypothetical protein
MKMKLTTMQRQKSMKTELEIAEIPYITVVHCNG